MNADGDIRSLLTVVPVPSGMTRAISRTGLARSSKGGLQHAVRPLNLVRRGASDGLTWQTVTNVLDR
jgi:hypothetical protein